MAITATGEIKFSDGSHSEFRDYPLADLLHDLADYATGESEPRCEATFTGKTNPEAYEFLSKFCEQAKAADDPVSSPSHYRRGGMECKDVMGAMLDGLNLTPEQAYWYGCAIKYLWRWPAKNGLQDVEKCRECLHILADLLDD